MAIVTTQSKTFNQLSANTGQDLKLAKMLQTCDTNGDKENQPHQLENGLRPQAAEKQDHDQLLGPLEPQDNGIKCSAVHTLERDMPDFDYSHLVKELRERILAEADDNPGLFNQRDLEKCRQDDWHLQRFLLRQKLDVKLAFEMLRKAMRFNNESLTHSIRSEDFPSEFYQTGGLFGYGMDRKGNRMLYIRVRIHKKIPEIQAVVQAFLYHQIQLLDDKAKGRGISIVFDCTGGGLANADMDMLLFLVSTLVNYFPKGLSYLLVHELPWILKPFWMIARAWVSDEHKQLIKFSNSRTIFEYIDTDQLPDFMGGTGKQSYKQVPDNCTNLRQAAKLWGVETSVVRKILARFEEHLPAESVSKIYKELDEEEGCANES